MTTTIVQQGPTEVKENFCLKNLALGRFEGRVAREVLLDSNELAADILGINGFTALANNFAKYEDVRKFYGVAESYFKGVLTRNFISWRQTPEDVHKDHATNVWSFSARMVLALSAIMCHGRSVPDESKAAQVYKNLKATRYYDRARRKRDYEASLRSEEHDRRRAAEALVEKALSEELNDSDKVEIIAGGQVLMSVGCLVKIIRLADEYKSQKESRYETKSKSGPSSKKKPVIATKAGESKRYESVKECAEEIGCLPCNISRVLNTSHTIHGYHITVA